MRTQVRPVLLVLIALLLGGALAPYPSSPAGASCAGPSLNGGRIVLTHDGEQTVSGQYFHDGCADTESCTVGCSGGCTTDDPESPMQDVELRIAQHGRSWTLGTVDADDDGRASWVFELPAGVPPGKARLLADTAPPMVIRVR